jgi:Flp pilus assembly CpaE family ATPase
VTGHLMASDIAADLARTIGTRATANVTVLVLQAAGRLDLDTDAAARFTDAQSERIRLSILTTCHPTPEGTPTS